MSFTVIKTEDGPHPGWRRTEFVAREVTWELLTIESGDEPRSVLYACPPHIWEPPAVPDQLRSACGFPGILTVEAAAKIVGIVIEAQQQGIQIGSERKMFELRKALGL